ncbi:MAG TPA: hypothetical protein VIO61_06270 [Anaerolineaceae bacterium]
MVDSTSAAETRSFLFGAGSTFITRAILLSIGFFATPLYIRYFGSDQYGVILAITSLLMLTNLLSLGIPSAMSTIGAQVYTPAKVACLLRRVVWFYLLYLGSLLVLLLVFQKNIISTIHQLFLPQTSLEGVYPALLWALILLISNTFSALFLAAFPALHRVDLWNWFSLLLNFTPYLSLAFTVWLGIDLAGFYKVYLILSTGFNAVMIAYYFVRWFRLNTNQVDLSEYRYSYRNIFATCLVAESIFVISFILSQVDTLFISRFMGGGPLVQYSVIEKLINFEVAFASAVFPAVSPLFARWFAESNWKKLNDNYHLLLNGMTIIGGAAIIGNLLWMKPVIALWVGQDQFAGSGLVILASLYFYLMMGYSASFTVHSSFNVKRKISLAIGWVEPVLKTLLSFILINRYGLTGASLSRLLIAFLLTSWLNPVILYYYSNRQVRLQFRFVFTHFIFTVAPLGLLAAFAGTQFSGFWLFLVGMGLLTIYLAGSIWLLKPAQRQPILAFLHNLKQKRKI